MQIEKLPELRYAIRGQGTVPMNYQIEVEKGDIFDLILFFAFDKKVHGVTTPTLSGTHLSVGEFWICADGDMYHVHGPIDYSGATLPWLTDMAECLWN